MNNIVSNSVNLLSKNNLNTLNALSSITKQQMPMIKRTFFNVASVPSSSSSSLLYNNQTSLLSQNTLLNNMNTRISFRFNSTETNSGKEAKKEEKKEEQKEKSKEEAKEETKEEEKKEKKEEQEKEKEPEMDPAVKKLLESKDKRISDLQVRINNIIIVVVIVVVHNLYII